MYSRVVAATAVAMMVASPLAFAGWTGSVNSAHYHDEIDLGVAVGSAGYQFQVAPGFSLVPELRAGVGYIDDDIGIGGQRVNAKINHLYGGSSRAQYDFSNGAYLFGSASYINYETKVTLPIEGTRVSLTDDSWELGAGGGFGYRFTRNLGADVSYERVDSVDVFSAGMRLSF